MTPRGSPGNFGLRGILSQDLPLSVVCSRTCVEIKISGAFVLNRRVDLHAIDATPARWRGGVGLSPLDGASTAASPSLSEELSGAPTHWYPTQSSTEGAGPTPALAALKEPSPKR